MSSILSSTAVPSLPGNPVSNATARSDEPGQDAPGSFSEALSRSRAPAGKATEKPTFKAPPTALARRQAAGSETLPDNLITAVTVPFIPLENRFIQATPTGGAGTAADGAASSSASPPLTSDQRGTGFSAG